MFRVLVAVIFASLAGCAGIQPPPDQATQRSFTQEVAVPYQEAYRTIAKQMRSCYRAIGLFGNGFDVQADMDSAAKVATVEVYYVGLASGAQKPDDSMFSRTVTLRASGSATTITTTGTTPKLVYETHLAIGNWLRGSDACGPRSQ